DTGDYNIDIGNEGNSGEANTIRIGKAGQQAATFIAGISGTTVSGGLIVVIDANGQLGTAGAPTEHDDLGGGSTAEGNGALANNTGEGNTGLGFQALFNNTSGQYNTASGTQALFNNTTGGQNTAAGLNALYSNTTGSFNVAVGYEALLS